MPDKRPPTALDKLLARYADLCRARSVLTPDEVLNDLLDLQQSQAREADVARLEAEVNG